MPYFVDSNVIIGYIFDNADTFGKQSKIVLKGVEDIYSGPTVHNECFGIDENGKCNTITQKITREFRRAIKELKDNLPIDRLLILIKEWKTCQILTEMILNYKNNIKLLIEIIRASQATFEADCDFRRNKIDDLVHFCDRDLPYLEIRDKLEEFIPDPDDVPVVLDAHHVGLKIENLMLISGNYWDISVYKRQICKNTSLADVIYLKYFVAI